jgi:prevent-host-death family protein
LRSNLQVNILEAKNQLSRLVKAAAAGREIIIASNGKPMAKLVPLTPRRRLGREGGIADPFDRLLLATAVVEGLHLLTADGALLDLASADGSLPIRGV